MHARAAIAIFSAEAVTVEKNKLLGLAGDALFVQASSNIRITDNILRESGGAGVWLDSILGNVQVDENRIAGFGGTGVVLANSSGVLVSGNEIEDNHAGLQLLSAFANRLESNDIKDNATIGIEVSTDSSVNKIQANKVDGIKILDSQDAAS